MDISEWREMAHWVEVYEWNLNREEAAGLEWICVQLAEGRFRNGTDVAAVASVGCKSVLLSGPSVRRVYNMLDTKRGAAKKLLAGMAAEKGDWPSIEEWDEPHIEKVDKTLKASKLEDKAMSYALDMLFMVVPIFEVDHSFDKHGRMYCDPAVFRFAEALAKIRYADKLKGRKSKSKSSSKKKEAA